MLVPWRDLEGIYFVYNLPFKKSGESGDSSSFC